MCDRNASKFYASFWKFLYFLQNFENMKRKPKRC